jgi:hypothetical protein
MKKLILICAILLVPAVAMAGLVAVSNRDMAGIHGQKNGQGSTCEVNILSNSEIVMGGSAVAWGDADGLGGSSAGWFKLSISSGMVIDMNLAMGIDIGKINMATLATEFGAFSSAVITAILGANAPTDATEAIRLIPFSTTMPMLTISANNVDTDIDIGTAAVGGTDETLGHLTITATSPTTVTLKSPIYIWGH